MCFFAIFVAFILITSLQERGLVAPTGYHATAIYTLAMYTGDGDSLTHIWGTGGYEFMNVLSKPPPGHLP